MSERYYVCAYAGGQGYTNVRETAKKIYILNNTLKLAGWNVQRGDISAENKATVEKQKLDDKGLTETTDGWITNGLATAIATHESLHNAIDTSSVPDNFDNQAN